MRMSVDMDNGRTGDYEREQYEVEVSSLTDFVHVEFTYQDAKFAPCLRPSLIVSVMR